MQCSPSLCLDSLQTAQSGHHPLNMGTGLSRFDALSVEAESTGIPSIPNCHVFVRSQQTNLVMKKRAPISFKSDYDYKVKDSQGHILLIIKSSPEFCFTKVLVDREGQVVVGMKNKPSPSRSRTFYLIVQKMGRMSIIKSLLLIILVFRKSTCVCHHQESVRSLLEGSSLRSRSIFP